MNIKNLMKFKNSITIIIIMNNMDIINNMNTRAWMSMAGAVSALVTDHIGKVYSAMFAICL